MVVLFKSFLPKQYNAMESKVVAHCLWPVSTLTTPWSPCQPECLYTVPVWPVWIRELVSQVWMKRVSAFSLAEVRLVKLKIVTIFWLYLLSTLLLPWLCNKIFGDVMVKNCDERYVCKENRIWFFSLNSKKVTSKYYYLV